MGNCVLGKSLTAFDCRADYVKLCKACETSEDLVLRVGL